MRRVLLIIICFILLNCSDKNNNSLLQLNKDDLKRNVIYNNDEESYVVLLDLNANDSINYESLSLSLLFANEENSHANLMVFQQMIEIFNKKNFSLNKFEELSQINKEFALYHLKRAATQDNIAGQIYLEEIYRKGIGIEKNILLADSILKILQAKPSYKRIDIIN